MYWRYNNYHPADQTKCLCLTKDNVYITCVAYKSAAFRGDWGWMQYDGGQTRGYELSDIEKWCPLYEVVEELNSYEQQAT